MSDVLRSSVREFLASEAAKIQECYGSEFSHSFAEVIMLLIFRFPPTESFT